jgi:hypothetical protein
MIGRIVHAMTNCMVSSQTSMAPQNAARPRHGAGAFPRRDLPGLG